MKKLSRIISLVLCLALALSLCACGGKPTGGKTSVASDDMSQHVELTWMLRSTQPEGFEEVAAAANEYLKEKLNVTLNFQFVEPGDYGQKTQLALASGENVDIMWTGNWGGFLYEANVAKGAFMPLDDLLKNEVPELWDYYSEGIWEATKVAGEIYGVPMEQIFHTQHGYSFIKSVSEELGLVDRIRAMAWVDENNHGTMEEMEEIYDIVREAMPSDVVISVNGVFNTFNNTYSIVASNFNIIDDVVVYQYDQGFETAKRARRWNQKGYFPADIATLDNTDSYIKEGKVYSGYNRYLPGVEGKFRINNGYDVIIIPTSEAVINRNGIQSTLSAVAATSKNPVRALKLIHLMHTDEYMLNLICYGIEGRDYTRDPNNPKRMERSDSGYYVSEFMVGSQFLAYLVPSYEDGVWEETKHENETAKVDDYIGFSFDPKPVESEISQVSAVTTEYGKIISCGLEDPEITYPERQEKMKLAGFDVIKEEAQRQLDEWLAEQK